MKKALSIGLVLLLCLSMLAACAKKEEPASTATVSGTSDNAGTADAAGATNNQAKTHSTGDFSFTVPSGWLEIPFTLNGEHNPTAVGVYKGATSEFDMLTKPGIQINFPSVRARISANKNSFTNVSDLQPLKLDNYTWEGFTGELSGVSYAMLWDEGKTVDFQVTVCLEGADTKVSLNDPDVLKIISSIKPDREITVTEVAIAPPEGFYLMTVYEADGIDMIAFLTSVEGFGFDPNSMYAEFSDNGIVLISIGDSPRECNYTLDGNNITIDMDGEDIPGTFDANSVILEIDDDEGSVKLIFEKAEKPADIGTAAGVQNPNDDLTAVQQIWNGVWYGYMWLTELIGYYEEYYEDESVFFDAYMKIDVDEDGVGTMEIYTAFENEYYSFDLLTDDLYIKADIKANEYAFEVTEGMIIDDFGDMELDPDDWVIGLATQDGSENMVVMTDVFLDDDLDGYEFIFTFRPYGSKWADLIDTDWTHAMVPPGFPDYIGELHDGAPSSNYSTAGASDTSGSATGVDNGDSVVHTLTYNEMRAILDEIAALPSPPTYDEVKARFGGVEGHFTDSFFDTSYYEWYVPNNEGGATVVFDIVNGVEYYSKHNASPWHVPVD